MPRTLRVMACLALADGGWSARLVRRRSIARSTTSVGSSSWPASAPSSTRATAAKPRRPSSRRCIRTVDRAGAVSAATAMSSKPATDTSSGTRMPSSASRPSAPSASRSLAQQIAVNAASPASSVSTPSAPPSRSNERPDDEPLVDRRARPRPARAGSPPSAVAGDEQRRRPGEERDPLVAEAHQRARPSPRCRPRCRRRPRARRAACGERWTTAAPTSRMPSMWRCELLVERRRRRGRSRRRSPPRRASTAAAARTRARGRASRSEMQVMTRKPDGAAASSTPRTISAKYGSVMSWTITPTTGTWLLSSPRASALGT